MGVIAEYVNGNLTTRLYSDGTRTRYSADDIFKPAFAENVDVHISNRCDRGCAMCYACCTPDGEFADLFNWKFLDALHPGTEMALNLNFPVHPDFKDFLIFLKEKGIIVNVTVNQEHFEKHLSFIMDLYNAGLINGLGVSLVNATHDFVGMVKRFPTAVVHVINGVLSELNYNVLKDNGLKILILGYKDIGRGVSFYKSNSELVERNKSFLYSSLKGIFGKFKVVSFDNLALEQLEVKRLFTDAEWEEFYGGDDGEFSFYINLVDGYFAKNSLSSEHYPIGDKSIDEMFIFIRNR